MASNSPGIYTSETDNTYYTNTTSAGNTTVAIIGYATKGPIGVPTEITSISNFKKTFGDYISGQYTGLAVSNIINAGGTVLFVRVADTTSYSRSNVIVKNGVAAECGKLVMDSTDTIYVDNEGYTAGNVYTASLSDSNGNAKKMIVRTAEKSAIKQANLFKQLSNDLDALYGYDEFKMGTMADGIYGFSLTNICGSNDVIGPYFVKTASSEDGSDLADKINDLINIESDNKGYTSPFQKIYVYKNYGNPESESESSGEEPTPTSKDIFLGTDVAFSDDVLSSNKIKINYSFTKLGSVEKSSIEFKKPTSSSLTFDEVASQLNDELEDKYSSQIHVKFVEGKTNSLGEAITNSYFLFYSTGIEGEGNSFNFTNNTSSSDYSTYMFMADNDTVSSDSDLRPAGTGTEIELTTYQYTSANSFKGFIGQSFYVGSAAGSTEILEAEYNSDTDSIIVSFDSSTTTSPEDTKVRVIEAGDVNSDSSLAFSSFNCDFGMYIFDNLGTEIARINGDSASDLSISKDSSTAQIYFYQEDDDSVVMESPTIDNYTTSSDEYINAEYYGNLLDIDGASFTEEDGTEEVKDTTKDMVVFTATEYGSGTASDIQVVVETETSSLDSTETHNIYVYANGTKQESFEDVSYDMKSDDYFVTLINEDTENGGSNYISVKVIKNETGTTVNLPDSADKNDNGYYALGEAPDSTHTTARTSDISEKSYTKYDYAVGDDGVEEGTDADELFIDAMDTEGTLANQDLYSFHVLITPDDINQDVQTAAIKLCETLGDAFYIADPPQGLTKKGVINWSNGKTTTRTTALTSNYAGGYWPWLKVYDSNQAKNVWVMPSVVMAAKYAEIDNDSAAGPQFAPAGETNGVISATDIESYPNKTDRDDLYVSNRINPFVKYNDGTILAYGEKTFQRKNSTLTKIHTRRMLIQMKKEIKASLKSFIFLPTISSNLNSIKTYVTTIMDKYKNNGGISSYTIDTSSNTTATLQEDVYYVAISLVPNGCLENINIDFTLNKSTESVSSS